MSIFSRLLGRSSEAPVTELPVQGDEGTSGNAPEGTLQIRHSQGLGADEPTPPGLTSAHDSPTAGSSDPPSGLPIKEEGGTSEAGFIYFKDSPPGGEDPPGPELTTGTAAEPALDPFAVKVERMLPAQPDDGSDSTEGLTLNFERMPLTYPTSDEAPTGDDVVVDGSVITGEARSPTSSYGDAGEQTYLAVEMENVQGGAVGTNEVAMEDTPGVGDPSEAAVPGRLEMPNLSFHIPENPAGGSGAGNPGAGFKISDNEDTSVSDSFSFGVEREMKESGEKGGTEDINIGVGELQETSISKATDSEEPPANTFSFGVEREMKESGEKGGTEDINIGVGELQEATISKSMDAGPDDAGGVLVDGGDADADGYRPIQFIKRIDKATPGVVEDEDNEGSTLESLEVQAPAAVGPAIAMAADDHGDAADLDLDLDDDADLDA